MGLIALASVNVELFRSSVLLVLGLAGIALFFRLDAWQPKSRLFPSRLFDWGTPVGSGMTMVAALSVATCSFAIYGPLLLTSLHGISVLTTGYIIAAESIAWSILSILLAGTPPHRERLVIVAGALMITGGVAGFAYAVPLGSIPLILFCAVLQGGGFGIAWPFVTRVIVTAAPDAERTITASAVPTLQRIGYAVGAASAAMVANGAGFAEGPARQAATGAAAWVFVAFVPLGIFGCAAAMRMTAGAGSRVPSS